MSILNKIKGIAIVSLLMITASCSSSNDTDTDTIELQNTFRHSITLYNHEGCDYLIFRTSKGCSMVHSETCDNLHTNTK